MLHQAKGLSLHCSENVEILKKSVNFLRKIVEANLVRDLLLSDFGNLLRIEEKRNNIYVFFSLREIFSN